MQARDSVDEEHGRLCVWFKGGGMPQGRLQLLLSDHVLKGRPSRLAGGVPAHIKSFAHPSIYWQVRLTSSAHDSYPADT